MDNKKMLSPREITQMGEKFYMENLKEDLEKNHMGEYVVIDVEEKKHYINPDRLRAVEMAQEESGNKLFYIIKIGDISEHSVNFVEKKYAWDF